MKVFIMQAEHFSVPGVVTRVCRSRDRAIIEAIACVNIMLADKGERAVNTEEGFTSALNKLQEEYGAENCYADISEHEVIGV